MAVVVVGSTGMTRWLPATAAGLPTAGPQDDDALGQGGNPWGNRPITPASDSPAPATSPPTATPAPGPSLPTPQPSGPTPEPSGPTPEPSGPTPEPSGPTPTASVPEELVTEPPDASGPPPSPPASEPVDASDPGGQASSPAVSAPRPNPALQVGDYEPVLDLFFPTLPDAQFSDDYDNPRGEGARVHRATDLFGPKGWPLFAVVDGVACEMAGLSGVEPSFGYSVSVCGDDGRRYRYIHLNNDSPGTDDGQGGPSRAFAAGLQPGDRVVRGQLVGYLGDSGNAEGTPPHLHFEILDATVRDPYGTPRINPFPSLVAALERGDTSIGTATEPRDGAPGETTAATAAGETTPPTTPGAATPPTTAAETAAPTTAAETAAPAAAAETAPPAAAGETPQSTTVTADRLADFERVGTGLALVAGLDRADSLVLATTDNVWDATVAAVLAARVQAPLLLSGWEGLDARVAARMEELNPSRVFLVGEADSQEIRDAVAASGAQLVSLAGPDVGSTSILVAERLWGLDAASPRRAILVNAEDLAEGHGLLAAALGAHLTAPVLFTSRAGMAPRTAELLGTLGELVALGPVDVPAPVAVEVRRVAGATSAETAAAAVELMGSSQPPSGLWLVAEDRWADAVLAGVPAAASGGVVVPVDASGGGPAFDRSVALIDSAEQAAVRLVGGEGVLLGGRPDPPVIVLASARRRRAAHTAGGRPGDQAPL